MSHNKIQNSLNSFSNRLEKHIDSYLQSVAETLEATVNDFIEDWKDENGGLNVTDSDYLKKVFLTGKHAFADSLEAFYDSSYEFSSQYELEETLEEILSDNIACIKEEDYDDKEKVYDSLKELGEMLHLTDSDEYQTQILRLLEEEFNIKLIALPQSHKKMF